MTVPCETVSDGLAELRRVRQTRDLSVSSDKEGKLLTPVDMQYLDVRTREVVSGAPALSNQIAGTHLMTHGSASEALLIIRRPFD